ncbi:ribosomal protein L7/L12 [Paenibacillus polysaccharolyticus]|uniref:ribosomal protein L7/L12 n=1 Tax=Paenibacillus polysaccharolyticus TaxID=582692 RepID=UPI002042159F|nr:ribosomal protein L7/L12 [Paenibacillus polysaccharolyticus]MCM3132827.1 ribosomal protein L7/L12 [Paenibacillus polysaccharolyticus]
MSSFLFVVFLLIIPILWSKLSNLQRQVHELKSEVERLQSGSSVEGNRSATNAFSVQNASSFSSSTGPNAFPQNGSDTELDHGLLAMVRAGNKIQAIKKLREARSLSLKEAKEYVEALDRKGHI